MTTNDQMIPADKIRRALDDPGLSAADVVEVIRELLPAPPRPTLADMTREERRASKWMQADVDHTRVVILVSDLRAGRVALLDRWGDVIYKDHDTVTPRPDLPPMTWPGDQKPAPAPAPALPEGWRLAVHPDYGLVVVTSGTPDEGGLVAFVHRDDDLHRGHGYDWCKPAELTFLDTGKKADQ